MSEESFIQNLSHLAATYSSLAPVMKRIAEAIALERHYRWVGVYEVTATEIALLACTGNTPPAFPKFPLSQGLCGSAVALRCIVNVRNVQEDPRWLTTFGTTRSEIIVPVFGAADQVVGLIDVESDLLSAFSHEDEEFLSRCAPLLLPLFP